jgi:hypothetical protein
VVAWFESFFVSFVERIYSRKISLSAQDTITFEVRDTTLKKVRILKLYLYVIALSVLNYAGHFSNTEISLIRRTPL